MIQNIKIEKLWPHKNNPRQDLGDLTELADSIKANGVMQNLTVVKRIGNISTEWIEGTYIVVIGHRRLAAAKLAGLEELPCSVVEMSERQQISTMLLENMQRADLTVYEQAHGFQMMLDLGDTVGTIAQQTGFSETTIRRRVKLMELDADKFKASQERGATLMDYVQLNEIEDVKARNKLLDCIGTSNFKWEVENALKFQKISQLKPLLKKELESFAKKIEQKDALKYAYVRYFYISNYEPGILIPKDAGEVKYFYVMDNTSMTLYKESNQKQTEEDSQEDIDREKSIRERESQLTELTKQAFKMRKKFILDMKVTSKNTLDLLMFDVRNILLSKVSGRYSSFSGKVFRETFEMLGTDYNFLDEAIIENLFENKPDKTILMTLWCNAADCEEKGYWRSLVWKRHMPKHEENPNLDLIYEFLQKLGYEMSSVEKSLQDGTHELFPEKKEGEEPAGYEEDEDDEENEDSEEE